MSNNLTIGVPGVARVPLDAPLRAHSLTRRRLLRSGLALLPITASRASANPLGLPAGLQLWTVRQDLQTNFDATLHKIAQIGYREVELFELPLESAEYRRSRFDSAGLRCVGGHFYLDEFRSQRKIDAAKELGLRYMIVVFPTIGALRDREVSKMPFDELVPMYEKITLDDYRWNAEQFNRIGETLRKNGLQLGYHNHAIDFKRFGGVAALDWLIRHTDPDLVRFELDCGHAIHAGEDPIAYLQKYPSRIELLHLKDLKPGFELSTSFDTELKGTDTELGAGSIDWKRLFQAARQAKVRHYFVEHEGEMDHPPLEAIRLSYEYLRSLPE